jgi:hypothetical protein
MLLRRMILLLAIVCATGALGACQPRGEPVPSAGEAVEEDADSPEEETEEYAEATTATDDAAVPGTAMVFFTNLTEGTEVTSPVEVCLEATRVEIEPAGDGTVHPGYGHHHILVDPTVEELGGITGGSGAAIPKDETHIHLGDGSKCIQVELTPGKHELVAVVADGAHIPLSPPAMSTTVVVVK